MHRQTNYSWKYVSLGQKSLFKRGSLFPNPSKSSYLLYRIFCSNRQFFRLSSLFSKSMYNTDETVEKKRVQLPVDDYRQSLHILGIDVYQLFRPQPGGPEIKYLTLLLIAALASFLFSCFCYLCSRKVFFHGISSGPSFAS